MIFQLALVLLASYLGINLVLVVVRHRKAHRFFKQHSPDIPVLQKPNIFTGHMYNLFYAPDNIKWVRQMHEMHGDTFGFYVGQYPVILSKNLKLIKYLTLEKGQLNIERNSFHFPIKEYHDSLFGLKGDAWRRCRRALAPVYTKSKVTSPEITGNIKERVRKFEEVLGSMLHESVAKTGFKRDDAVDFFAKQEPMVEEFTRGISGGANKVLGLPLIYPPLRPVMKWLAKFSEFGQLRDRIVSLLGTIIEDYKMYREQYINEGGEKGSVEPKKDFSDVNSFGGFQRRLIDYIVDAHLNKQITYDQLIGNMWSSFIAGYATTADSMSSLAWLLAEYPKVQEKLRKVLKEDGIENEYVNWCILEGLRLFPSVPLGTGRILAEDVSIDGVSYPKGVFIMFSTTEVQIDPRSWKDPLVFNPERWIDRDTMDQAAFIAFGLGPRDCPGRHLAIQESKLIFEMILANYRIEKCEETPESYDFISPIMILTSPVKPVHLRFVAINTQQLN